MQKINNRKQNAPAAGGPSEMDPQWAHRQKCTQSRCETLQFPALYFDCFGI